MRRAERAYVNNQRVFSALFSPTSVILLQAQSHVYKYGKYDLAPTLIVFARRPLSAARFSYDDCPFRQHGRVSDSDMDSTGSAARILASPYLFAREGRNLLIANARRYCLQWQGFAIMKRI
jgi:hypothetical protein